MAKKGKKGVYSFKLGPKASVFYDPQSKVKVTGNAITEFDGRMTARLSIALANKHIIALDKGEKKELEDKLNAGLPIFENMAKADLLKYYADNYEVSDEEAATFAKLNKNKMVEVLDDLTEEEEDE